MRTVITEEQRVDKYPVASLEPAKLATEQNYYEVNTAQIVDGGTVSGLPAYGNDNGIGNNPEDVAFAAANSTRLYRLNGGGGAKTGLGMVLKVMSGDKVDILGRSFYSQPVTNNGTCSNCGLTAIPKRRVLLANPRPLSTISCWIACPESKAIREAVQIRRRRCQYGGQLERTEATF